MLRLYYFLIGNIFILHDHIQIKCLNLGMTKWVGYVGLVCLVRLF